MYPFYKTNHTNTHRKCINNLKVAMKYFRNRNIEINLVIFAK